VTDLSLFGRDYLQQRIVAEFALARHLGVVVESADDSGLILTAPLAPNANHKGTAFGGSLFSLAVLTGWAWLTRYLACCDIAADAVIQESSMHYLLPVQGTMRASLMAPARLQTEKFRKMLQKARRGRIELSVQIHEDDILATRFEGAFVAALR
jgi:thioesterase domain-containing protein